MDFGTRFLRMLINVGGYRLGDCIARTGRKVITNIEVFDTMRSNPFMYISYKLRADLILP